jgi:hydrogenase maturation protease
MPHAERCDGVGILCDVQGGVLVLCLGNDILRDDGIGWAIADALEQSSSESQVPSPESRPFVVKRSALSGFYLLDELTGWERVIVVDGVQTGLHPPGTILSFPFEALGTEAGPSPHAVGLPTVVRLGRQSGVPLPAWIHIVAIEVDDMETFTEGLTPAVQAAVPEAVGVIISVLAHLPAPAGASARGHGVVT